MKSIRSLALVLLGSFMVAACTSDKKDDNLEPKACKGDAKFGRPTGRWLASQYDSERGLQKTLSLGIGTTVTEVGISCVSGGMALGTQKVVGSDYSDEIFELQSTGVLEAKKDGVVCRLEDMGGVYDLSFGGECLVLKNKKGKIFLQRDTD